MWVHQIDLNWTTHFGIFFTFFFMNDMKLNGKKMSEKKYIFLFLIKSRISQSDENMKNILWKNNMNHKWFNLHSLTKLNCDFLFLKFDVNCDQSVENEKLLMEKHLKHSSICKWQIFLIDFHLQLVCLAKKRSEENYWSKHRFSWKFSFSMIIFLCCDSIHWIENEFSAFL